MSDFAKRQKGSWKAKAFMWAWMLQRGVCACCGRKERFVWRKGGVSGAYSEGDLCQWVWRTSNLEVDHIEPLHRGGGNEFDNLQLLCIDCHKAKSALERSERARAREYEL